MADWVEIPNKSGLWRTGGIHFVKMPLPIVAKRRIPVWHWLLSFAGAAYGAYDSTLLLGISALWALALLILRFRLTPASGPHLWLDATAYVDQQSAGALIRFNWSDVETAGWVTLASDEPDFVVQLRHPIRANSGVGTALRSLRRPLLENEYCLDFDLFDIDPHVLQHAVRQLIIRNGGTVVDRLR